MEKSAEISKGRGYSWLSILVGIVSIVIGIWCIVTPVSTLAALTLLFIVGFFVAGALEIVQSFSGGPAWGWRLVAGIINIFLGVWLVAMPAVQAAVVMEYVVGFWIFFYSAMGIVESVHMRRFVSTWGWMLFFNICGLICSFLFLLSPAFGGLFIVWLVGISFVSYGIFRCMLPPL